MKDFFFVLHLLDDNGEPLGDFTPEPQGQQAAVAWIDDGEPGMGAILMSALLHGVAMTVVSADFEWGRAIVHLPQAWEGETDPGLIGLVLSASEPALIQAAGITPPPIGNDDIPF